MISPMLVVPAHPTVIPAGLAKSIKRDLAKIGDLEAVQEGRRRLMALRSYVTKKEHRRELEAAERWCEIRIGELLGKGERGQPGQRKSNSIANEIESKDDKYQFRLLAEHKELISSLINEGVTARRKLILAIRITEKASSNGRMKQPNGPFDLILSDPPWKYDFSEKDNREVENEYLTQPLDVIIGHKPNSGPECVLFLWATAPKLLDALQVMSAWGFEYKTNAVWDKEVIGMGYWFRGQHELLLVGTKGRPGTPIEHLRVSSVFREKRGQHSRKPLAVYEWIERAFPHSNKLEMYCRGEPRLGWFGCGDECR